MNLNFTLNWLHSISQLLLFTATTMFLHYSNLNLNWYDIYSRTLNNEFYINLYYFLWTSFWYIPLFIFIITVWQYINHMTNQHVIYLVTILLTLLLTALDVHFYWVLNTNTYTVPLKSEYFNNLLLNSINKYHPGLLYWSTLIIITYRLTFNLYYVNYLYHFYSTSKELFIVTKFIWSGLTLFITLGLGGWWALQEGSWGGWWNWDPSEVFGLIILIFYIPYLHRVYSKQTFIKKWYWDLTFFAILLQIYYFTQLNFDLVSHNFGTKIDNFIDNTNLYTFIIFLSYLYITWVWSYKRSLLTTLSSSITLIPNKNTKYFRTYVYIILTLFIYEISYSLIPLLNDFLWKLFTINIANYILIFEKYSLQIVYLILLYFWKYSELLILCSIYTTWSYCSILFLYLYIPRKITYLIHWLISLFMWASLLTFTYIFTQWGFTYNWNLSILSTLSTPLSQVLININNISLDYTQFQYTYGSFIPSWNTIWVDTTPEVYSFLYYISKDISNQLMVMGSNLFVFSVNINDILSLNLILILALLVGFYTWYFTKSKKIIF